MISTIAHLSDIHIRKNPNRNEEYKKVFEELYKSLRQKKPDRIVIVGDLVHDYLDLQTEQLILASDFLNELSKIAPVRITRGNHDYRSKSLNRVDSIKAIVETLHNPNVLYLDKTAFFADENIMWAVWHHGEKNNNPWKTRDGKKIDVANSPEYTFIDLYHESINGCKTTTGFEMKSKSLYKISDFRGQYLFLGHIHRMQYLDKAKTKAFSGSLLSQDVTEGDDAFHGYLLWDIVNKTVEEVPIHNDYSFKNIKITQFIDFEDLDFEIDNPTKYMRIRFIWNTLPQTRNKDAERKLIEHVKISHSDCIFSHKNEFIETEKIDVNENVTLENITNKVVQHEIFKDFLVKIGTDENVINDVIALDEEIIKTIDIDEDSSIEWNIIRFGGNNFMSYFKLDIDWRDDDGLYQIAGINTAGKTTILKIISYVLFGKTLETENVIKFGNKRFINNRNGADSCDAYIVLEANGEYYGIKRKTKLTFNKSGEINGAPTVLSYYQLATPDDELNDETSLDKLDEDRRAKTQKKIDSVIGTYDNFQRIVMTTSDTLNQILSNDMAVFIDSLLFDSGLDIFDKKLEGYKIYQKKVNEKSRVTCNIESVTNQNVLLVEEIQVLENEINNIETNTLPAIQTRISEGRKYVENLTKKLFKIDTDIYNLNVDDTKESIGTHNNNIIDLKARETVLRDGIVPLKKTYDVDRLNDLIVKKDAHKTEEYAQKMLIKGHEQQNMADEHSIEIFNGDIFRMKAEGAKYKKEIFDLKESKFCPTCGQALTEEHQEHINDSIKKIESLMFPIADAIKKIETVNKKKHIDNIEITTKKIEEIKKSIEKKSLDMEVVLKEIGKLTNEKNDVEKRKELQIEIDNIPTKIQNEELKISLFQQKIDNYENSLKQIEENKKMEIGITAAKAKITLLEGDEVNEREDIFIRKNQVGEKRNKIVHNEALMVEFKAQEYRDLVMELYKKCVHRDGIPRQMLSNYILPRINVTLENILSISPFKVWLDTEDLKPKLSYNNRPDSIIDCISASGKERTFSSVVLKFALNQINVKAKPTIFLLDEVMGKLDDEGTEEFIEILQLIKSNMKKVLLIEHVREINPDFIINVTLDENGISSLEIK